MVLVYSQISKISVKRNRTADVFPNGVFIHLEIMLTTFGFLHINDVQTTSLNDDLRLQRVPLFFPE